MAEAFAEPFLQIGRQRLTRGRGGADTGQGIVWGISVEQRGGEARAGEEQCRLLEPNVLVESESSCAICL